MSADPETLKAKVDALAGEVRKIELEQVAQGARIGGLEKSHDRLLTKIDSLRDHVDSSQEYLGGKIDSWAQKIDTRIDAISSGLGELDGAQTHRRFTVGLLVTAAVAAGSWALGHYIS